MKDARIIIDELIVDCATACAESEAQDLGNAIARALASQLRELQAARLQEFRRGAVAPAALHLERVVVRLAHPRSSPAAIGRSLRDAIDDARRREHA